MGKHWVKGVCGNQIGNKYIFSLCTLSIKYSLYPFLFTPISSRMISIKTTITTTHKTLLWKSCKKCTMMEMKPLDRHWIRHGTMRTLKNRKERLSFDTERRRVNKWNKWYFDIYVYFVECNSHNRDFEPKTKANKNMFLIYFLVYSVHFIEWGWVSLFKKRFLTIVFHIFGILSFH